MLAYDYPLLGVFWSITIFFIWVGWIFAVIWTFTEGVAWGAGHVCGAVLAMRSMQPNAERPFKAPWFPFVPIMGIAICLLLMFSLPAENWVRLVVWLVIGFLIYFGYGKKHSVLNKKLTRAK